MRTVLLISFFTLFSLFLNAQNTEKTEQKSLLWEISGNGLQTPSYIFGTIHMIPKKDYFFTEIMQNKFKKCKVLALEIHLDSMKAKAKELAPQMMYPDGKTLKDYVSAEDYKRIESYSTDTLKVGKIMFSLAVKMKPFFGSSIIMMKMIKKPVAYEEKLFVSATKNKMKVVGLETFEYQLSVINKVSIEDQVQMMFLDEFETNPIIAYNKMLAAYKTQNLTKLVEASTDDSEDFDKFEEDFLLTRNRNWIPVIEKLISEKPTFIAVGAAHLTGDKGVLRLLEAQGYTVKPIN